MELKFVVMLYFFLANTSSEAAQASAPLQLTPETVVSLAFEQGIESTVLRRKLKTEFVRLVRAKGRFDMAGRVESQYQVNNIESLQLAGDRIENATSGFGVRKPFSSGTVVTLQYSRRSDRIENPNFLGNPAGPNLLTAVQDVAQLEIEQSLLNNSFGLADRSEIKAEEYNLNATELETLENLEMSVLESLRLYWRAYVAHQNLQEALEARSRYQKLLAIVKSKSQLGYSKPGELSQVEAELESRIQMVKLESQNYLNLIDQLRTTLQLERAQEIVFTVPKDLPKVPNLKVPTLDSLREIQVFQAKLRASEMSLLATESRQTVSLKAFSTLRSVGFDQNSTTLSFDEMLSGNRTDNLVGMRFESFLLSSTLDGEKQAARAQKDLNETLLHRARLQISDKIKAFERKVAAQFFVAESSQKLVQHRVRAAKELQKSFEQGRVDLDSAINAMNALESSQVNASQQLGEFYIAINEFAATVDELIKEEAK